MYFKVCSALIIAAPFVLLYVNRGMVLVFGALALALLPLVRGRLRNMPWSLPITAIIAAYVVLGAASIAWEVEPGNALAKLPELIGLIIGGAVITLAARAMPDAWRDSLPAAAILGLAASVCLAVADTLSHMEFGYILKELGGNKAIRMQSLQPTMFKAAASVATVMIVPLMGWTIGRRNWRLAAILIVAVVVLTVLSHSNAALLGLAGGVVCAVVWLWRPRLAAWGVAMLVVGLFVALPFANRLPKSDRLAEIGLPNSTIHRTVIWAFVADRIAERPLLGWGLNSSRAIPGGDTIVSIWHRHVPPKTGLLAQEVQLLPLHPHNFILQVWLETGAIGAALFSGFLLALTRAAAAMPRRAGAMAGATLVSAVLVGGTTFGLWQAWWLCCVWIAALMVALAARSLGDQPTSGMR